MHSPASAAGPRCPASRSSTPASRSASSAADLCRAVHRGSRSCACRYPPCSSRSRRSSWAPGHPTGSTGTPARPAQVVNTRGRSGIGWGPCESAVHGHRRSQQSLVTAGRARAVRQSAWFWCAWGAHEGLAAELLPQRGDALVGHLRLASVARHVNDERNLHRGSICGGSCHSRGGHREAQRQPAASSATAHVALELRQRDGRAIDLDEVGELEDGAGSAGAGRRGAAGEQQRGEQGHRRCFGAVWPHSRRDQGGRCMAMPACGRSGSGSSGRARCGRQY